MPETYSKSSDGVLIITKIENVTDIKTQSYEQLLEHKKAVEAAIAERQIRLTKINSWIVEADKLGIKPTIRP